MADITLIPSAKVPLIYPDTNTMSTEWYRFFWNIYGFTGTGVVPVNKGGTGLNTIGNHQLIIGNANNVFEPASLSSASIAITYPAGFINLELGTSGVTPGTYGSASTVGVFTVNAYGVLTAASNTSIGIDASQIISGTLPVIRGGTGQSTYTDGQLLIGNSTGNTLTKATLTAGTGISVTNGAGAITIGNTGVLSVSGTAPVVSSGGATPAISMAAANTTTDGYLTSTDWNTFNNKAPATSGTSILYGNGSGGFSNVTIGTGVSFVGGTLSATGSGGTVTSVAALTLGTTGTDLSSTVANSTTTPVITLNVPTASATNRGALSAADWTTFNSKQAALVSGTNIKTVGGVSLLGSGDVGTIGVGYGGTGITSYTIGDLIYASGITTLSKLADVATGNALISGGVNVAPSWGKIGLTTHVSGTLPTANGGTNLTSFTADGVVYASSTSALATSSGITYDGANFAVAGTASAGHVYRQGTYTDGATTPSVAGVSFLYIANTSATTITNFTGAVQGQIITLIFSNANTTITRNNAYLSGGVNFVSTARDSLTLIYRGADSQWYEVARSVNA